MPPETAPSLRDSIESSFSAVEARETAPADAPAPAQGELFSAPAPAEAAPAPAEAAPAPSVVKAPQKAEAATPFKRKEAPSVVKPAEKPASEAVPAAKPGETPAAAPAAAPVVKAPASWKPDVREKWAGLPPEVQGEVLRREKEVQTALNQASQARQFAEAYQQVTQPYAQMIAMDGGDPLRPFGEYLRTAAILRSGGPAEKAAAIASACQTFGVDLRLLDSALAGQPIQQSQQPGQPGGQQPGQPQFQDPRVDQLFDFLNRREQETRAHQRRELDSEIESFAADPKNEFFEDLRSDIAILLRTMAEAGRTITLKEAYDRAAFLHPEISKVMQQRQAAQAAQSQQASLASRRAAASSLRSQAPAQTGTQGDTPSSVRAAIEQSLASLGGGL